MYDFRKPRANHNPCYGRGYTGTRTVNGVEEPVICGCVLKRLTAEASLKRLIEIANEEKASEVEELDSQPKAE